MGVTEGDLQVSIEDVDMTLENCTIPYTYFRKDQPPPSNLVVYSTTQSVP